MLQKTFAASEKSWTRDADDVDLETYNISVKNPNTPDALATIVYRCLTVQEYGLEDLEKDLVDFLRKD